MVAFDLPTTTAVHKREYIRFHSMLISGGFSMLQFSIYARPCASREVADTVTQRVEDKLPPEGEVRIFAFTASQFSRTKVFQGTKPAKPEEPPEQITLF